jgi:hypothetical protein
MSNFGLALTGLDFARARTVRKDQMSWSLDLFQDGEPEAVKSDDGFLQSRAGRPNLDPDTLLLHMRDMAQRLEAASHATEKALMMQ